MLTFEALSSKFPEVSLPLQQGIEKRIWTLEQETPLLLHGLSDIGQITQLMQTQHGRFGARYGALCATLALRD